MNYVMLKSSIVKFYKWWSHVSIEDTTENIKLS